jgi:hypothetical protein
MCVRLLHLKYFAQNIVRGVFLPQLDDLKETSVYAGEYHTPPLLGSF